MRMNRYWVSGALALGLALLSPVAVQAAEDWGVSQSGRTKYKVEQDVNYLQRTERGA